MSVWERTAELLESGPDHPDADLDRQIRELIRTRPWAEVGAVMADTHRELSHCRSTEAEDVAWAAGLIPILRPQGWEQAPKGEALEQAILAAYRPHEGRSQGPTP
ncbi:MAG: hypothetical protein HKL89_09605 [Candidatus Dormibacteraeota bacterium]|nr:hypothetical protein [Candidatus Dormibacteraeota bacterium]